MKTKPLPSQSQLSELLDYDPETGILTWKARPHLKHLTPGKQAGSVFYGKHGTPVSLVVKVLYQRYAVHRLIWVLVHGSVPDGVVVDHKNRNPLDNRLENLRLANYSESMCNRTGYGIYGKGVYISKSRNQTRYRAKIQVHGNRRELGLFSTPEEAAEAYRIASAELHGDFACAARDE